MYEKLMREIESRGITRNKLAKMAGIASQSLYPALAGKSQMFPGWRKRIAEALDVPESVIFADEEDGE